MINNLKTVYNDISKYYLRPRSLWPEMKKWSGEVSSKDSVLDVGCGEGRLLQGIGVNVDYTGIDFSEKLTKIAKERYKGKKYKFITGDITKENTWKNLGEVDKIFAVAMIHHLPNRKEQVYVLKKMKQHLKRDGKIYVSFWNLWQKKFWSEHLKNFKLKLTNIRWIEIPFTNTGLKRFYFAGGKKYWESVLTEAGWKSVKIELDASKKNMWVILD